MNLSDLQNNIEAKRSLDPAAITSSTSGTTVTLTGDDVYSGAMVNAVVGSWTDGTHDIHLEERDSGGTFADVTSGDIDGSQVTVSGTTDESSVFQWGYTGTKDEVRVASDVSGATTGAVYGADVIVGGARDYPVT